MRSLLIVLFERLCQSVSGGVYAVEAIFCIQYLSQNWKNDWLTNWRPLSWMILLGTPNR